MARDIIIEDLKLYYTEELFKEQTGYTYTDISDIDLNKFFQKHCDLHKQVINVNELSEKYNDSYVLVNTPDGFQDINDLYIKGPYSIYTIKTADFSIKCSSNHLIETIEGWKHAENLIKGDTILTKNGYQDVTYIYKGKSEITYDFEVVHENHRYWGGNGISSHNTGKSYLSCSVVREAQKKGYDAVYIDSEGAIDAKFVSRLGVDPNKLIIKQVSTIFETSNFLSNILKALEDEHTKTGNRRKVIFVLDSLGNLTSDKEKEDMLSGNQKRDMTKQQEIKAMFRVIATPLARAGAPLIVVNHVYAMIGAYVPTNQLAGGQGLKYNSSVTLELSTKKLEDKENDNAAASKAGTTTKNGVLVKAKPIKSRFTITRPVQFGIPFFKSPNPYVGLEEYMTWENSGVCRGNVLTEKEYLKLSTSDQNKCHEFEFNGEKLYALEKDTARGIAVKHLGRQVSFIEFWSDTVFTDEYLHYLDENVFKPLFELPDQSAFDDLKDIEESLGASAEETDVEITDPIDNLMND